MTASSYHEFVVSGVDSRDMRESTQQIAPAAQKSRPKIGPMSAALEISLEFELPRPESLPKRILDHKKLPDCVHLMRAVAAGLDNILFNERSQICSISLTKKYGKGRAAKLTIGVSALEEKKVGK